MSSLFYFIFYFFWFFGAFFVFFSEKKNFLDLEILFLVIFIEGMMDIMGG